MAKQRSKRRPGSAKTKGWQPNARRAAARKRPQKEKEPAAVRQARRLIGSKQRVDKPKAIDPSSPVDLGPVVLPSPDDAVRVLRVLAEVNDRAINAKKAYLEQQAKTKTAKSAYDDLMEEVHDKLRQATHKSDLPLIDIAEREHDQQEMENAAAGGGVVDENDPVTEDILNDPPF